VILVCRTYPIRVAGNSGPFWFDSHETSWDVLGVDPESERTTVTKKVRRVATFSFDQVRAAAQLNGATEIALTFTDYLSPRLYGVDSRDELDTDADSRVFEIIDRLEFECHVPVTMLGTGPHSVIDLTT
jgi:adenylosuccinate synthase